MAGNVYRVAMEGEDGMNESISYKSNLCNLDADILKICTVRERFRLELLKVELELLRERVRSA